MNRCFISALIAGFFVISLFGIIIPELISTSKLPLPIIVLAIFFIIGVIGLFIINYFKNLFITKSKKRKKK